MIRRLAVVVGVVVFVSTSVWAEIGDQPYGFDMIINSYQPGFPG